MDSTPEILDPRIHFDVDEHKILLPHVICVEGNIGSGKSTLLDNLDQSGFRVIPEPVQHIWGQYLPRLYTNLERWGCSFQMEVIDWFRQLQATHLNQELKQSFQQSHGSKSSPKSSDRSSNLVHKDSTSSTMAMFEFADKLRHARTQSKPVNKIDRIEDTENVDPLTSSSDEYGAVSTIAGEMESSDSITSSCANADLPVKIAKTPENGKKLENVQNVEKTDENALKCGHEAEFIIVERSALSAFEIFASNLHDSGLMSDWEFSLLKRWYSLVMWQPKYVLYLRCDPKISVERIHLRNRNGENKVDPSLIKVLHERHEKLFVDRYGKKSDSFRVNEFNTQPTAFPSQSSESTKNAQSEGSPGSPPVHSKKPSIIYVNGNNDAATVLKEAVRKIESLPEPEKMLCNICSDCGTPRVQPRLITTPAKCQNEIELHLRKSMTKSRSESALESTKLGRMRLLDDESVRSDTPGQERTSSLEPMHSDFASLANACDTETRQVLKEIQQ